MSMKGLRTKLGLNEMLSVVVEGMTNKCFVQTFCFCIKASLLKCSICNFCVLAFMSWTPLDLPTLVVVYHKGQLRSSEA